VAIDDPSLLPPRLAAASLSQTEVVLTHADALQAIDHLMAGGHAVFCWEGWLRFSDGRHGHSVRHQGIVEETWDPRETVAAFAARAGSTVRATIMKAQEEWNQEPEAPNAVLYFCLSVRACPAGKV
jgi:hypothetical protein